MKRLLSALLFSVVLATSAQAQTGEGRDYRLLTVSIHKIGESDALMEFNFKAKKAKYFLASGEEVSVAFDPKKKNLVVPREVTEQFAGPELYNIKVTVEGKKKAALANLRNSSVGAKFEIYNSAPGSALPTYVFLQTGQPFFACGDFNGKPLGCTGTPGQGGVSYGLNVRMCERVAAAAVANTSITYSCKTANYMIKGFKLILG